MVASCVISKIVALLIGSLSRKVSNEKHSESYEYFPNSTLFHPALCHSGNVDGRRLGSGTLFQRKDCSHYRRLLRRRRLRCLCPRNRPPYGKTHSGKS